MVAERITRTDLSTAKLVQQVDICLVGQMERIAQLFPGEITLEHFQSIMQSPVPENCQNFFPVVVLPHIPLQRQLEAYGIEDNFSPFLLAEKPEAISFFANSEGSSKPYVIWVRNGEDMDSRAFTKHVLPSRYELTHLSPSWVVALKDQIQQRYEALPQQERRLAIYKQNGWLRNVYDGSKNIQEYVDSSPEEQKEVDESAYLQMALDTIFAVPEGISSRENGTLGHIALVMRGTSSERPLTLLELIAYYHEYIAEGKQRKGDKDVYALAELYAWQHTGQMVPKITTDWNGTAYLTGDSPLITPDSLEVIPKVVLQ